MSGLRGLSGLQTGIKRKLLKGCYLAFDFAVIGSLLILAGLFYVHIYGETVVNRHPEKLIVQESSIMVGSDGTVLRKIPLPESGYRTTAELGEMPDLLINTFLAVEDRRFYRHQGLDYAGIARALFNNTLRMDVSEGGSSITQQLARNLYLNRDKNMLRKLNEASIALALEKRLSKSDILKLYLNQIYMGEGQYGVKAAAEHYFGITDLKRLDVMQIAALAAIPKGPSIYNPADDSGLSVKRRELVLDIMRNQGLITREEKMAALQEEYHRPAVVKEKQVGASYIDAALAEASQLTGKSKQELQTGGYTIVTGMNKTAQRALEETFLNPGLFPPDGKSQQVEAAMTIVDHRSGEVVALIGGRNPSTGDLNRAIIDARQPGSAFKPIIDYGPALESGLYTPESMLQDRQVAYGSYRPENMNGVYRGQITMKMALQQSINAPAVWLLKQVGISRASEFSAKLGIKLPKEDRNLSIALGGLHIGVSPLKMAQAYSVFASGGVYREAHMVRQIKDPKGNVLYEYKARPRQVISPHTAEQMTGMLRSVVNEGTGKKGRMNRPVAGKTGTTQLDLTGISNKANRDLWFVGYTPEWTAAVWMGFDRTDKDNHMNVGSGMAAALFSEVMGKALVGR
ncbi:PBP1A family penicillin-binding protein [Paenibacillus sp.]|jgi:penicillin-binding protein 2A|uniref:transglycosylase domain-containing protein n=1 Tax=Paenibacillus sp. TaxID=58172 RepID=UPI00282A2198|nr:PBP1A family penicillin-binding protein [Paenibacillus sp.]MDR0271193.1 PBP1A family penicillin-binding protein [Paenibacillus sp.]